MAPHSNGKKGCRVTSTLPILATEVYFLEPVKIDHLF